MAWAPVSGSGGDYLTAAELLTETGDPLLGETAIPLEIEASADPWTPVGA